jgi:pimeloyl-ACP methyl ester carboxylesterase
MLDGGSRPALRTWIYQRAKQQPDGAVLLLHGLHYAGPSDPRLDRFASILAAAGMLVYAPFLPAFVNLRLEPSVFVDTETALKALLDAPFCRTHRPGLMSISFGSLPALALAAHPVLGPAIDTLVLFGGYASLADTMRFCVNGSPGRPHDPLNQPVVFLNLLEHIDEVAPEHRDALVRAWMAFVRKTWGRVELKHNGQASVFAREIAADLHPAIQSIFLRTTGTEPGAGIVLEAAIAKGHKQIAWIDPAEYLPNIRTPTHIIHGADDDVISYTQAQQLARAMDPNIVRGVYVTGLYGHSGKASFGWGQLSALAQEVHPLLGALGAIAAAGGSRLRSETLASKR